MAWDDDAYYETELEIPSGRYGKLLAMPGGVGPAGPPGEPGAPGPAGPPGPAEGVEFQVNKGVPDGYAPLGADGLVPAAHLPASTGGGVDTMAELTDVTPTGLAVGTAVDAKAGRAALVAERDFQFNVLDYGAVGDGAVNDRAAIQAAITACQAAGGGVVYIPKGTYLVSGGSVLVTGTNITVQGAGRTATILKTTTNHAVLTCENAVGPVVRDLQVLGDADATKTAQFGVWFDYVTGGVIENVWAKNLGYDGILLLRGCNYNTVSNCIVTGCQDDSINIGGHPDAASTHNVVVGNTLRDGLHVGVHISWNSQFTTVSSNTIANMGTNGIDTFQVNETVGMGGNSITGNTVSDCGQYGIYLFASDDNVVSGNTITRTTGCSIYINRSLRSIISNNQCTGAADTNSGGVYSDVGGSADLIITNNLFAGVGGVSLAGSRTNFQGNRVRGATVASAVLGDAAAIDSVISDNIISDCTGNGINVTGTNCVVSGNRVIGGTSLIRAVTGGGAAVIGNVLSGGTVGVELRTADCQASSNTIYDCPTGVLVTTAAATNCLVNGNHIRGNSTNGVSVATASGAQVTNNRIATGAGRAINVIGSTNTLIAHNYTSASGNGSLTTASTGTIVLNNRFDATVSMIETDPIYRPLDADLANYGIDGYTAANYHRSVWRQRKAVLTATVGATLTATGLIPDGALLFGVTTRINTALGVTGAVKGYTVGTAADPDLWGSLTGTNTTKSTSSKDFTDAAASTLYTAAGDVVITATGGTFDGTGEIEVIAHYMICETSGNSVLLDTVGEIVEDLNSINTLEGEPVATTLEGQVPVEKPAVRKRAPRKKTT
jgi:parallel beta-helix repeat protein